MRLFDLIGELIQGDYWVKWEMRAGLWLKPAGYVWNVLCRGTPVGQIIASLRADVILKGAERKVGVKTIKFMIYKMTELTEQLKGGLELSSVQISERSPTSLFNALSLIIEETKRVV